MDSVWKALCNLDLPKFVCGYNKLGRMVQCNPNLDAAHNKKPVLSHMKNFFFDVELHEVPMRQALIEVIGADQVLYRSNSGGSDAVRHDLTDGLKLSDDDLQKIRLKNVCKLLHIDPANVGSPAVVAAAVHAA